MNTLVFQNGKQRISVDKLNGVVEFQHCHSPKKFWTLRPAREFKCRLQQIYRVHNSDRKGTMITTIVTAHGKARVVLLPKAPAESKQKLKDVRNFLSAVSGNTPNPSLTEQPEFAYAIGFLVGFAILGLMLATML